MSSFFWMNWSKIHPTKNIFFPYFIHSRNKYAKKTQSHTFIQLSCKISAVNKMSLIYAYIHWFFAVFVSTQTPDDWRSIMGRWPHKYLVADWGKYSSAQDNIMCRVCSFSGDPDPISPSLLSMYWRLKTDSDWNTQQWEIMIPPSEPYPISKLYTHCTNIRAVIQKGGPRAIYWLQCSLIVRR